MDTTDTDTEVFEPVVHTPILAVDETRPIAMRFAAEWAALHERSSGRLDYHSLLEEILLSEATDATDAAAHARAARVAASFIAWLGTNVGQCLLDQARDIVQRNADQLGTSATQMIAAWAVANRRETQGSGWRAAECFLTPHGAPRALTTQDDYDTIERVIVWLAEASDGREFLAHLVATRSAFFREQQDARRAMMRANRTTAAHAGAAQPGIAQC